MVRFNIQFASAVPLATLGLALFFPSNIVEAMISQSTAAKSKLLIIGLGRVGKYVADLALDKQYAQVFGTVRQSSFQETRSKLDLGCEGSTEIVRIPFDPVAVREHLFGCTDEQMANNFSVDAATHVLFTIPLSREIDPAMEAVLNEVKEWWEVGEEKLKNLDNDFNSKVLGILSTTGVYGNHDGNVVTEDSELLCEESSNAALYRQFEGDWISLSNGGTEAGNRNNNGGNRRLCIFRCAGIYDSSRSALHTLYKNLESGTFSVSSPTPKTGNKTNRIHSFDLARGVLSAMFGNDENKQKKRLESSEVCIYNLSDNLPEVRSVVLAYAEELFASIGIDQSTFSAENETAQSTEKSINLTSSRSSKTRRRRRERESKEVCNKRMREELLPQDGLVFPTYQEGLRAILNDSTTPWQQRSLYKLKS